MKVAEHIENCCGDSISSCSCHEHEEKENGWLSKVTLAMSAVLLLCSFLPALQETAQAVISVISALLAAYPIIIRAFGSLFKREFDENILLAVSIPAAFALGEMREAAAIALFFRMGECSRIMPPITAENQLPQLPR
jgi:cation transport ATPase